MALIITVKSPESLLRAIKAAIDEGIVKAWEYDKDGDFSLKKDEWTSKAWLRPKVESEQLILRILAPTGTTMSRRTYAIYHARFVDVLLTHFDSRFSRVAATALASQGDIVNG